MQLLLVGVSHRTAPIELRERIDFSARGIGTAVSALAATAATLEAAILSTCNRVELYVACHDVDLTSRQIEQFISEFHGIAVQDLAPYFYVKSGSDAARHLFRVAAGLDSLVVGEPQVLGQVKEAYSVAVELRCTGPLLNRLFPSAFSAGKRVRSETALAEGAVSVSYAAVTLARKIFGDLSGRTVLVLGAGEMGKLTAIHMRSHGIQRLIIMSRTAAHAAALADSMGGSTLPWDDLETALGDADIVITATGASAAVLSRARIAQAMKARRQRPLFIIDIAVPRDVEPSAGDLEQVFLYNIDDLQAVVQENLSRRAAETSRAEAIVSEEVARFVGWLNSRGAVPTVVALRQRFEAIRQSELRRLEPKLASLSPEARGKVEEITRIIVEKLLITPTEQLKSLSDVETVAAYSDALNRLFSLEAGDASAPEERTLTTVGAANAKTPAGPPTRQPRSGPTRGSRTWDPRWGPRAKS